MGNPVQDKRVTFVLFSLFSSDIPVGNFGGPLKHCRQAKLALLYTVQPKIRDFLFVSPQLRDCNIYKTIRKYLLKGKAFLACPTAKFPK